MSIETQVLTVSGMRVSVVRKDIKNLHLGVYPPDGRVRVAAPSAVSDAAVRVAVIKNLGWIKRKRAAFERQCRQSSREMVSGESHYFLGRRYRLRVLETERAAHVVLRNRTTLELYVRAGSETLDREQILMRWYRAELRELVPPLLETWQRTLGVEITGWGIKRMKTQWGTCNVAARRIWLNLELAKKPLSCIEYVVVHELLHLITRYHGDRFERLLDRHLPRWRLLREELYATPLAEEDWKPLAG